MKKILLAITFMFCGTFLFAQIVSNPVDWTATAKKIGDKTYEIHLTADIKDGWHIYSQTTAAGGPIPTSITFTKNPLVDYELGYSLSSAAEPVKEYLTKPEIDKRIREKRRAMETAAKDLNFMLAAKLRDEIKVLQEQV